jgi:hypothetical protein
VKASGKTMSFVAACTLYVPGGLVALILAASANAMPLPIIPFHLTEILADSLVYGAVLTRLFAPRLG